MSSRSLFLLTAMAAVTFTVALPPWRIRIRQKGDDLSLPWRRAPVWNEAQFSPTEMAGDAGARLGAAINPADCEAVLDAPQAWLQLAGVITIAGFGWLALADSRLHRTTVAPADAARE